MTPYEFLLTLNAYSDKMREHYNDLIYMAWHVEAFARKENLPELETLMQHKHKKKKIQEQQTSGEMFNTVKLLNAMYGGKEVG